MEILRGWMRVGDQADCGGTVAEGASSDTSGGTAYTYQGARMSCNKHCTIAEGYPISTLPNGAAQVLDGQHTSGGCRLISTLNGVDGVAGD
jgi:uncharacterized Zn-binding protein involved in type VI secretion